MPNGNLSAARARTLMPAQVDSLSIASNGSSATVSSGSTNKSEEKAPIKDERSDLLAAIRTGEKSIIVTNEILGLVHKIRSI